VDNEYLKKNGHFEDLGADLKVLLLKVQRNILSKYGVVSSGSRQNLRWGFWEYN